MKELFVVVLIRATVIVKAMSGGSLCENLYLSGFVEKA